MHPCISAVNMMLLISANLQQNLIVMEQILGEVGKLLLPALSSHTDNLLTCSPIFPFRHEKEISPLFTYFSFLNNTQVFNLPFDLSLAASFCFLFKPKISFKNGQFSLECWDLNFSWMLVWLWCPELNGIEYQNVVDGNFWKGGITGICLWRSN